MSTAQRKARKAAGVTFTAEPKTPTTDYITRAERQASRRASRKAQAAVGAAIAGVLEGPAGFYRAAMGAL